MNNKPSITPEFKVFDFDKSLSFYVDILGFSIEYDRPEDSFAMLKREGARIMIEGITTSRFWKTGEIEAPLGRAMNLQIELSEIDSIYENLKNARYPLFLEMEEKWYRRSTEELGSRQFLVQDPNGYLLRFAKDLGVRNIQE